jgi:hypothetical protein
MVVNQIYNNKTTQNWKRLKKRAEWWCRPSHLAMFTKAYTKLSDREWEKAPRTSNPQCGVHK